MTGQSGLRQLQADAPLPTLQKERPHSLLETDDLGGGRQTKLINSQRKYADSPTKHENALWIELLALTTNCHPLALVLSLYLSIAFTWYIKVIIQFSIPLSNYNQAKII